MADIIMCNVEECPLKEKCFRFTAYPNQFRQSFFKDVPYNKEKENYDNYWNNKECENKKGRK